MQRKKWICAALCAVCLMGGLVSCGGGEEKKSLPESKGLPGELLLIVDKALWESPSRDSLESVLKGNTPALTQAEPLFRMMRIFPENYSGKYSTMRNIIEVRLDPEADGVEMSLMRNAKAVPQVYLNIKACDAKSLNHFLMTNSDLITSYFLEGELAWEASKLRKKYSKMVDDTLRSMFGCGVRVPAEIGKTKRGKDFLWASSDRLSQDVNFVCYALPLADSSRMTVEGWTLLRDSVMKVNIPGSTPDKWMATTYEGGKPLVLCRQLRLPDGRGVYEMRGLWEMRNGALGGPFVSLAYPDTARGGLIVAEGFIYSPDTKNRDLVRRMEAALRTLTLPEQ